MGEVEQRQPWAAAHVAVGCVAGLLVAGLFVAFVGTTWRRRREPDETWASHRLVGTLVGCALALVATNLLWPRDSEVGEPVTVAASSP